MAIARLSYLDIFILSWIATETQRSNGILAASGHKLLREFSRKEKEMLHQSIVDLENKGVIVVGRASGGTPAYLSLTPEGQQCLAQLPGFCDV